MRSSARPRKQRCAHRGERGAIIIELAIIAPLLGMLITGILEFGMGFRDSNVVVNANRAGARTAASQGKKGTADYYTLQAIKAGLASIKGATVQRIVIYNATTNVDPDPACLSLNPPIGWGGWLWGA